MKIEPATRAAGVLRTAIVSLRPGASANGSQRSHFPSPQSEGPGTNAGQAYRLVDVPQEHLDVEFDGRKIARFVYRPHDASTPDSHDLTYKPFHQVFDPDTGSVMLSSGVHPKTEKAEFPHHRGIFFGVNRINYGDRKSDNWHCNDHSFTTCERIIDQVADQHQARFTAVIAWHGSDSEKFAEEHRAMTVSQFRCLKAGSRYTQLDWSTRLVPLVDKIQLDGDPQHAGFHFRANQEVALKTATHTYFIRPDGKGEPGETRNWEPQSQDPRTIDLPWNAMSFVVSDERYTVLRISDPANPSQSRGSERDYGRFGDYFEADVTPESPLVLKYRLVVAKGSLETEDCQQMADQFVDENRNQRDKSTEREQE